jgi:hypothetical protein
MFEVFMTTTGATLAYKRTAREAVDYASTIGGADYEVANEGYYLERATHGYPSTVMPIRYNNRRDAINARDMANMSSDTSSYSLIDLTTPIG